MIPVSAPLRFAERLRHAPDGELRVVHRGADAIYLALPQTFRAPTAEVVGVVSTHATQVPCALRTALPSLAGAGLVGERAEVRAGRVVLDGHELGVGRVIDVRAPRPAPLPVAWRPAAVTLPAGYDGTGPVDADTALALLGRGPGLTPLGDDVLAGWLATRAAQQRPDGALAAVVESHADHTTALSATLLRCAIRGEVLPELAAYLRAVGTHAERPAVERLLTVGATSGAGLLAGAGRALLSAPAERNAA